MKQSRAGDELPQHDAEREHVGRARPGFAPHLLGRHVRVRAAHRAGFADRARDAEIDEHDAIAVPASRRSGCPGRCRRGPSRASWRCAARRTRRDDLDRAGARDLDLRGCASASRGGATIRRRSSPVDQLERDVRTVRRHHQLRARERRSDGAAASSRAAARRQIAAVPSSLRARCVCRRFTRRDRRAATRAPDFAETTDGDRASRAATCRSSPTCRLANLTRALPHRRELDPIGAGLIRSRAMGVERLGRYSVLKHLASGGMADVAARAAPMASRASSATSCSSGSAPSTRKDQRFIPMFLDEARVAASLHHQNIVQVHDIGEDERRVLLRDGVHPRRGSARSCCSAVVEEQDAHAARLRRARSCRRRRRGCTTRTSAAATTSKPLDIVHRDVSPSNIVDRLRRRGEGRRLRHREGGDAPGRDATRAASRARSRTCRPSSARARRSIAAATSSRSASCSTSSRRRRACSRARTTT